MSEFNLDSRRLAILLEGVENGDLKLPCFQRSYKWKPSKVKKLLDSIQKNHPAGSLLFLEVDPRKKLILDEPFKFTETENVEPEHLVLDGQQRLTSCYCAFFNKGTKSYYFDLMKLFHEDKQLNKNESIDFELLIKVKERDFYPDKYLSAHLLPLSFLKSKEILRTYLVSYKQSLRDGNFDSEYINFLDAKLESYLDPFFDYRFPIIVLPKKLPLDAVCKVFQTINTTGLKLSAFDICVAKFMTMDKNLKNMIKKAVTEYNNILPIIQKDETIVLQIIALLADKSPKKNKLADSLDFDDMALWDKAIEGLSLAVELLTSFGTGCNTNLSLIPYQPAVPVISAILIDKDYKNKNVPIQSSIAQKLKKWFYTTSLILRYTEGTDNKMKEDYLLLKKWIMNDIEPYYVSEGISWNPSKFINLNKSGAIGKAILCAINFNKPNDFYSDTQVGLGISVVECQLHHIFPDAKYSGKYNELINSAFNFTFLTSESNNYIRDKQTSTYLNGIISERGINETNFLNVLKSHFIDVIAYEYLKQEDYLGFIKQRAENIRKFFVETIGLKINMNESEDEMNIDDDFDLTDEQSDI